MRNHSQYTTRLLEFLVKARQHMISGQSVNLSHLCNQIHVGAQLPTVLMEHGIISQDRTKKDFYHWNNGQAVDAAFVSKVSGWSREYAKKKAAIRVATKKAMEGEPIDTAHYIKNELEVIQAKLDLIIERFGLK